MWLARIGNSVMDSLNIISRTELLNSHSLQTEHDSFGLNNSLYMRKLRLHQNRLLLVQQF